MRTLLAIFFFTSCTLSPLFGAHSSKIYIVPVVPSPEPGFVDTTIQFPQPNQLLRDSEMHGQIKLLGFPLGMNTKLPRAKVIYNDPKGQSLHVFIDNEPYFSINEALTDALQDFQEYFVQTVTFTAALSSLSPGMHVLRALPVLSYNESLKGKRVMATRIFYYKVKENNLNFDPRRPYLTFNEPQGEYDYVPERPEPILLDFYLTNCKLSNDGYKLRVSIDGEDIETLTSWQPYYIYGLKPGKHEVRLQLLDPHEGPAPGALNDVTRTIELVEE